MRTFSFCSFWTTEQNPLFQKNNFVLRHLPQNDNDEVEPVPGVAEVGVAVQDKSAADDLQEHFSSVDRSENVPGGMKQGRYNDN